MTDDKPISEEEVDRIVESLDRLILESSGEVIKSILQSAANDIYYLVYDEDE